MNKVCGIYKITSPIGKIYIGKSVNVNKRIKNYETMTIPFLILLNHFIADFLFQTDKMALEKSSSIKWLSIHVLTYSLSIIPFSIWVGWTPEYILYWIVINGVLHWITDFFTSRLNAYLWKKELRHWFFVSVGGDQLIHYACLFWTYEFIKSM